MSSSFDLAFAWKIGPRLCQLAAKSTRAALVLQQVLAAAAFNSMEKWILVPLILQTRMLSRSEAALYLLPLLAASSTI